MVGLEYLIWGIWRKQVGDMEQWSPEFPQSVHSLDTLDVIR
jgi:hypothetical protein